MPPRSDKTRPPRSYLVSGHWPDGKVDGPPAAVYTQHLARALGAVLEERGLSLRAAGQLTGVDRQTIARTLAGDTVPDLGTIATLETGLDADLWPRRSDVVG